jgi:hypothetical protein
MPESPAVGRAMIVATALAALLLALSSTPADARRPAATRAPSAKGGALADAGARSAGNAVVGGVGAVRAAGAGPTSSTDRVATDAGVVESRTLDGGTHVFKFSELDIEGRLKSPQLVYFLRRVRAEFAAGELGHRSFLHEMSETRRESSF